MVGNSCGDGRDELGRIDDQLTHLGLTGRGRLHPVMNFLNTLHHKAPISHEILASTPEKSEIQLKY
jgi:hypothetical protein